MLSSENTNVENKLEGTASYGRLLLAPAEGWWPSATWIAVGAPPIPPHAADPPTPCTEFFLYMGPPPTAAPPTPLHRVFLLLLL